MKKRLALLLLFVNLSLLTPAQVAGFSFEIPVGEAMANQLAQAYFPQPLSAGSLDVLAHNPRVFMLDDNRVGLSANLRCAGNKAGVSSEGAVLISALVDFDAASRELVFSDPAIDSLIFFEDNQASRVANRAIVASWQQLIANPVLIGAGELDESELLTRYLRDIVVRDGVVYFVYGAGDY